MLGEDPSSRQLPAAAVLFYYFLLFSLFIQGFYMLFFGASTLFLDETWRFVCPL
jgi:hypothetical protein